MLSGRGTPTEPILHVTEPLIVMPRSTPELPNNVMPGESVTFPV